MQRRGFIGGIVATGAVLAAPSATAAPSAGGASANDADDSGVDDSGADDSGADSAGMNGLNPASSLQRPAPWALLAPLSERSDVGLGWRIQTLSKVSHGAAILTLSHENGGEARVHLCSVSGQPRGVAHSQHIDLMLMNHGDGRQDTHEAIGRVLKTLAKVIRGNERCADARSTGLLPHTVRVAQFRSKRCLV